MTKRKLKVELDGDKALVPSEALANLIENASLDSILDTPERDQIFSLEAELEKLLPEVLNPPYKELGSTPINSCSIA